MAALPFPETRAARTLKDARGADVALIPLAGASAHTLTIDDPETGGSDPGAWALAIAHTPRLDAMVAR